MEITLNLDSTGLPQPPPHLNKKEQSDIDIVGSKIRTEHYMLPALTPSDSHDELYKDADVTDCVLLPRTFWLPSGAAPANNFERIAKSVFDFHLRDKKLASCVDHSTSGAEWWCQVRPSPPSGRYAATDNTSGLSKEGVVFHYDKDEDLNEMSGIHVFPHVSTVTYLTDLGAPTVILDRFVDSIQGGGSTQSNGGVVEKGVISYPAGGKHVCFDGRSLHAVVACFKSKSLDEELEGYAKSLGEPEKNRGSAIRRGRRITFLVNVWVNYKPIGVERWDNSGAFHLSGESVGEEEKNSGVDKIYEELFDGVKKEEMSTVVLNKSLNNAKEGESFSFSIGSDEEITFTDIPLSEIQKNEVGGTCHVEFGSNGCTLKTAAAVPLTKKQKTNDNV